MTQPMQPSDIVDACTQWMVSSIDAWATSATALVDSTTSGSYNAADWFAETSSYFGRMVEATMELVGGLVGGGAATRPTSDEFDTPAPKKGVRDPRHLRMAGPLTGQSTQTTMSASAVTIVPESLTGAATTFHLEFVPGKLPGDAYWGTVNVLDDSGAIPDTVTVVVQVP